VEIAARTRSDTLLHRLRPVAGRAWRYVRVWTLRRLRRRDTQILLGAFALAVLFHLVVVFFPPLQTDDEDVGEAAEVVDFAELTFTAPPPFVEDSGDNPLNAPPPLTALNLPSVLPHDFADTLQPEPEPPHLNGFNDVEDGGSAINPVEIRSGGGGGSAMNVAELGRVRSDDASFRRLHWKPDPGAKLNVEVSATGTGNSIPGTATRAGAGAGLGNGNGSGALASSGSGSGSGVGINGANSGHGLGQAAPLPVTRNPALLYRDPGHYPAEARANGHAGTVLLYLVVQEDGSVANVDVHVSSGYSELDDAAVAALKNWRFIGALKEGRPIKKRYQVPFTFTRTEN
jgi:TonB family protein